MNAKCIICGRPVPAGRRVFCGIECAQEHKRRKAAGGRAVRQQKKGTLRELVCPDCGKAFTGHYKCKRCPECAAAAMARAGSRNNHVSLSARRIGSTALCERCGRPYIIHSGAQRYCADCSPLVRQRERYAAMTDTERAERRAKVHAQYLEHRDATIARARANYYGKKGMQVPAERGLPPHSASGSPIAAARIAKGWTQQQLDAAIGARYNATATWESGRRKPGEKTLRRIAEALGVDWTTLIE